MPPGHRIKRSNYRRMPADYQIDLPQHLIRSRCWGELSDADITTQQEQLRNDPNFHSRLNQLVDAREITSVTVSMQTIRQIGQSTLFAPESRRAYVVAKDVMYGLVRMYELYQNLRGSQHIRAFRDHAEALRWLGVDDCSDHRTQRSA